MKLRCEPSTQNAGNLPNPLCQFPALALLMAGTVFLGVPTALAVVVPPASQIITLRPGVDVDAVIEEFNLKPSHVYRHALNGFAAPMDSATFEKLKQDGRVLAAEPDGQIVLCAQTVPSGVLRMGITNFPVAHIDGGDHRISVDVAVMDTGIQTNHPDLNVFRAVDCTGSGLNGNDWNGHGTHVAGTIGALDNNFGVVGVAPGVRLWSVQVISPTSGADSQVIAGLDYIYTNADKISVVNASFSGFPGTQNAYTAMHLAVSNVVSKGIVFVAAAGNNGADITGNDGFYGTADDVLPAALTEVMAVSAMDPTNDEVAIFTNYSTYFAKPGGYVNSPGLGIDVTAPGVNILSTWTNSSYAVDSGTSMASAHASGLVALYVAANGRAHSLQEVYQIRQKIIDNSQPQSQWRVTDSDQDGNPEPLAFPSEAWVPAPNITSEKMTAQGFQLNFTTVPGYTYTVQYRTSLAVSNQWTNLTSTNGTGSVATATLVDAAPDTARFYRVMRQPAP